MKQKTTEPRTLLMLRTKPFIYGYAQKFNISQLTLNVTNIQEEIHIVSRS